MVRVLDWGRERFTATPGTAMTLSSSPYGNPVLQVPHLDGRLAFASTETSGAFAGHPEGAILAGRRAAGHALNPPGRHGAAGLADLTGPWPRAASEED